MTCPDAVGTLVLRAFGETGEVGDAVVEAVDAMERLAAIRKRHEQGAVTTDGGRVIYASIHGHELHRLLYGELNAERD